MKSRSSQRTRIARPGFKVGMKILTAVENFEKPHLALQKAMMCDEMAAGNNAQVMQLSPVELEMNRQD